jgi:uncharacterized protein (DUF58 family)
MTISRIDTTALMRIKSLELRAKVIVEGLWRGLHRSPYHGFSVEFTEYRAYSKGDDLRHIDWKVAARTDRYYIKKFEDETNLRCQVLLDMSKSMGFGTGGYSKADYAATLAATLASFLMQQGDAVGLTTFGERIVEHIPARNRPGHLRHLMTELEKKPAFTGTSLQASLQQLAELLRRRGMVVLVSDLLTPVEQFEKQLGYLSTQGHEVVVFHLMDRAEKDFTFDEAAQFYDSESGSELFINPSAARESYLKRLGAHLEAVKRVCDGHRADHRLVVTDEALGQVLLKWLGGRK